MMMLVTSGVVQTKPHKEGPTLPLPGVSSTRSYAHPSSPGKLSRWETRSRSTACRTGRRGATVGPTALRRPNDEGEVLALLTTEVFTNADRHSRSGDPGGQVIVTVTKTGRTTQVKITDDGPRQASTGPHLKRMPMQADEGDHGGFGLCLVTSLATRWGVLHEDEHTTVWFDIDRPEKR